MSASCEIRLGFHLLTSAATAGFGIFLMLGVVRILAQALAFRRYGVHTEGRIIEITVLDDAESGPVPRSMLIEFRTETGDVRVFRDPLSKVVLHRAMGDAIPVIYDRRDPSIARIDEFEYRHALLVQLTGFSLLLFIAAFQMACS